MRIKCKCGKLPIFGIKGMGAICCASCKTSDMIDVKHKLCKCRKARPLFGPKGGKSICCNSCKTSDMTNVKSKKCSCGKRASFGIKGGTPTHCSKCKDIGRSEERRVGKEGR